MTRRGAELPHPKHITARFDSQANMGHLLKQPKGV